MPRRILWACGLLFLTACAAPPKPSLPAEAPASAPAEPVPAEPERADPEAAPVPAESVPPPVQEDQAAVMFHVLSGELAAKQGDLLQALQSYLAAMRLSGDPRLAEQAARLALYLDDQAAAREASERWRALAPADSRALETLAVVELRAGNADMAESLFAAALELDGQPIADGLVRAARILAQEEDKEAGLTVLQRLVEAQPEEPKGYQALAELALQAKRPELALEAAEQAAVLAPEWTAPNLLRVRAYLQLEQGEAAVKLLEDVIRRHPEDLDLRLQYARTLLSLEQTQDALSQLELLLEQRPKDAQVLYTAALLAMELGQNERARKYLLSLVNAGARTEEAYYYLGRLAQAEGDSKGALRWYREVQGEYRLEAQLRIAALLAREGQLPAARDKLAEIRRGHPDAAVRAFLVEAEVLRNAEQPRQAYEVYGQALQQYPDNSDLRYARALLGTQVGELTQAEADLRLLLAEQPDNPLFLNALGYTLVDLTDRHQEGYELILRAHQQRPEDPAIIDSLGWALYRLGQLPEARRYLEQAYALSPESEIAAHLAEVLWRLGEREAARKVLQAALEADAGSEVLRRTRERLK